MYIYMKSYEVFVLFVLRVLLFQSLPEEILHVMSVYLIQSIDIYLFIDSSVSSVYLSNDLPNMHLIFILSHRRCFVLTLKRCVLKIHCSELDTFCSFL